MASAISRREIAHGFTSQYQAIHYCLRSHILQGSVGENLFQSNALEGVLERDSRSLSGITVPPRFPSESPADFKMPSEGVFWLRRQYAGVSKEFAVSGLDHPAAEAMALKGIYVAVKLCVASRTGRAVPPDRASPPDRHSWLRMPPYRIATSSGAGCAVFR